MNEPELGDGVPMASSLLTAMPAASSEGWSHPSSGRGGTGASGSEPKAFTGSPLAPSSTYIRTRFRCYEDPRYWANANNGDRYLRFGGKSHIRLPGRGSWSLFPAFRATHGWESRRWGKMYRASVTSSSGALGCSSRARIRGSAITKTPRLTLRGQPPCERGYR